MSFEAVDEMERMVSKISQLVKHQKHLELSQTSDAYKFKSVAIEKPPIEMEFLVPFDEILVPELRHYHETNGKWEVDE